MRDSRPIFPAPLRRKILLLLAIKVAALVLIYWMFFGPHQQANVDGASTAARILGQASAPLAKDD